MKEIDIDKLIAALQEEKEQGVTTVKYTGTLFSVGNGNSVIITTESQI